MTDQAPGTLPALSASITFEDYTKAMHNILEDFTEEKRRLEQTQRAMLNLLEDFDMERERTEAANRELKEAEARVKKSLGEKEVLLKEIHHRVKNNLQIIHSMLNLQLPYIKDKQASEMFTESQNRIYSMALIHEKLYQSESLARIDLAEYIQTLTDNLFLSYSINERTVKPRIHVEKITLDMDQVIPCALILNELVSNSLKHAFPHTWRRNGGRAEIRVDLRQDTGEAFTLIVGDNGVGIPENFELANCQSLGLKLVNALVKQLKGTIEIDTNGGTKITIRFKAYSRGG